MLNYKFAGLTSRLVLPDKVARPSDLSQLQIPPPKRENYMHGVCHYYSYVDHNPFDPSFLTFCTGVSGYYNKFALIVIK